MKIKMRKPFLNLFCFLSLGFIYFIYLRERASLWAHVCMCTCVWVGEGRGRRRRQERIPSRLSAKLSSEPYVELSPWTLRPRLKQKSQVLCSTNLATPGALNFAFFKIHKITMIVHVFSVELLDSATDTTCMIHNSIIWSKLKVEIVFEWMPFLCGWYSGVLWQTLRFLHFSVYIKLDFKGLSLLGYSLHD